MLSPADEIKSKLDIVETIRQYAPLKAAGTNFVARCPFHNEKTPSFSVSPTKQVWYCFGCGRGGDLFSFIMEVEKLTFVEALRLLAPKAGVVLTRESGPLASKRNQLLDILASAADYYHRILMTDTAAEAPRAYLKKRGIDSETAAAWKIGYAPDSWDDVTSYLSKKGFSDSDIVDAGLAVRKEGANRIYNRFRGRIMFPIAEVNGNVVGFSGRILPEFEEREHQGKYINTPQTMVYDKSRVLFGLDKAKSSIRDHDLVILVEGQMDCIAAHQAGYANVVASSGTALTVDQVTLMKRFTNRLAFALDMDKAGRAALERGSEQSLALEMETLIISLPDGKDPDDCIRQNPEGWKQAVREAKPVMEHIVREATDDLDPRDVSSRRTSVQKLLPWVSRIANPVERDFWIKKISQAVDTSEAMILEALARLPSTPTPLDSTVKTEERPVGKRAVIREELLAEQALAILLMYPAFLASMPARLSVDQLPGSPNQAIYRFLIVYYNKNIAHASGADQKAPLDYQAFRAWLIEQRQNDAGDTEAAQALDRIALMVEKDFSETTFEQAETAISSIITQLRHYYVSSRLRVVTGLISELESQPNRDSEQERRLGELLKEFNDLALEIRQLSA